MKIVPISDRASFTPANIIKNSSQIIMAHSKYFITKDKKRNIIIIDINLN